VAPQSRSLENLLRVIFGYEELMGSGFGSGTESAHFFSLVWIIDAFSFCRGFVDTEGKWVSAGGEEIRLIYRRKISIEKTNQL